MRAEGYECAGATHRMQSPCKACSSRTDRCDEKGVIPLDSAV